MVSSSPSPLPLSSETEERLAEEVQLEEEDTLPLREGVTVSVALELKEEDGVADPEPDSLSLVLKEGIDEYDGVALAEEETDELPVVLS